MLKEIFHDSFENFEKAIIGSTLEGNPMSCSGVNAVLWIIRRVRRNSPSSTGRVRILNAIALWLPWTDHDYVPPKNIEIITLPQNS